MQPRRPNLRLVSDEPLRTGGLDFTISKDLLSEKWIYPKFGDGSDAYTHSVVWNAPDPIYPIGVTPAERIGKLVDYALGRDWPAPATLALVQTMARESKLAAAAREKEADKSFGSFVEYGGPVFAAAAKEAYSYWKSLGKVLNSHDGDSDDQIQRLGDVTRETLGLGWPVPWKLMALSFTATAEDLADRVVDYGNNIRALSPEKRDALRRWWAGWLFYADDPMFERLYGSPLMPSSGYTTDGIVILASAPYAKASGRDLKSLAAEVWAKASPGKTQVESFANAAMKASELTHGIDRGSAASEVVRWIEERLPTLPEAESVIVPTLLGGAVSIGAVVLGTSAIVAMVPATIGVGIGWMLRRRAARKIAQGK